MTLRTCPACGGESLEPLIAFPSGVTSDSVPIAAGVENFACWSCGLVVNATGVRGREQEFFAHTYDLLADSVDAEFTYETERGLRGINAEMVDFLASSGIVAPEGRLLEVGCGKGMFLRQFRHRFDRWQVAAVEPSRNARHYVSRAIPGVKVHEGSLESSPFAGQQFDLAVSIGVLEHVPDPVAFAGRIGDCLSEAGTVFLSVPNFDMNPSDLFTFDHLSRFTPESLTGVLARAGLQVTQLVARERVPMWVLAHRAARPARPDDVEPAELVGRASAAARWAREALAVYEQMAGAASGPGRRIGIYGTGIVGIAAVALNLLPAESIACFFDDNPHLQGGRRVGRPVVGLSDLHGQGITDIGFSANPCYLTRMERRAASEASSSVRLWRLPPLEPGRGAD